MDRSLDQLLRKLRRPFGVRIEPDEGPAGKARLDLLDVSSQQLRRNMRPDAEHKLLTLLLRLHRLGRELRDVCDETGRGGNDILGRGIEHDADIRADRDTPGLRRW